MEKENKEKIQLASLRDVLSEEADFTFNEFAGLQPPFFEFRELPNIFHCKNGEWATYSKDGSYIYRKYLMEYPTGFSNNKQREAYKNLTSACVLKTMSKEQKKALYDWARSKDADEGIPDILKKYKIEDINHLKTFVFTENLLAIWKALQNVQI